MNYLISLLLICYISQAGLAQNRKIHLPKSRGSDTPETFWYSLLQERIKKFELSHLQDSPHQFHLRLWTGNEILDIWKNQQNILEGSLIMWAKEYADGPSRHFFKKYQVSSNQVAQVKNLIDSTQVLTIPSDSEIAKWRFGCDGITYKIEFSDAKNYYFKTYWTPSIQKDVAEAKIMRYFIQKIREKVNYELLWRAFTPHIPYPSYIIGDGSYASVAVWSQEKINLYRQKRREYLKSLKKKKRKK
ncbi:MAG TPA: hypothetical protein DCS93_42365 [Microscillaceae bacterium]|nr:hypothetical protein [Microscillaceae bacterium]